jgi:UDP-N-acetylmuramoylalanine--D-glutamate ligase
LDCLHHSRTFCCRYAEVEIVDTKLQISPGVKVAVLGLGVTGRAAVNYLLLQGAEVFVSDIRPAEKLILEEADLFGRSGINWETGKHTVEFLAQADVVIVSPGISITSPLIAELRLRDLTIAGELAFADGRVDKPVIAITGTNGKTSVTTLVGELLKKAGKRVFIGGNIGTSLFDYFCNPEDFDILVLEVSSFQLETGRGFSPHIAVLLNISPDHLDRHGSFRKYCAAKMKIFSCQKNGDVAITNGDDPFCRQLPENILSDRLFFGIDEKFEGGISGDDVVLFASGEKEIYHPRSASLKTRIGLYNCAPAIIAARLLGCTRPQIQSVLNTFSSLEHRMEYVTNIDGIEYYNDSKATNTGAVVAALSHFGEKVVLIAGGRDKGDDYTLLRPSVSEHVKALIVIGESADIIEEALQGAVDIVRAESMRDAVGKASEMAEEGDSVLLSPACASFDMFAGYAQRGRAFKDEVMALPRRAGLFSVPLCGV